MIENNSHLKKIYENSYNQFKKCLTLLDKQNYEKSNAKNAFYFFLFNDLIQNMDYSIFDDFNTEDLIDNSRSVIYELLLNIYNSLFENNKNLLNDINKKLIKDISNIKIKIKECNDNLLLLKNIYINEYISNYFPSDNKNNNFNFENKKVLYIHNEKERFILSEFFTRFLFNLIKSENITTNLNSLTNDFYDEIYINQYIDFNTNPFFLKEFKDIDINFKYWFFLIYISYEFFQKNTNFNLIFKSNELDKFIKDTLFEELRKEEEAKKKQGSKKKKKPIKGGDKPDKKPKKIESKKKEDEKKNTKNKKKIIYYRNIFNDSFNNIYVNIYSPSGTVYYKNLKEIYQKQFQINMVEFFKDEYSLINNLKKSIDSKLKNPFNDQMIPIKNIYKISNSVTTAPNNNSPILDEIKFDIFESLNLLIKINNKDEINIFLKELKKKIILHTFYLYSLKKKIYEEYIESLIEIFNLNIESNIKESNKKESDNLNINYSKKFNSINQNKLFINNKLGIQNMENKVKFLKQKNNVNSLLELLKIENEIKKKIAEKHNSSF